MTATHTTPTLYHSIEAYSDEAYYIRQTAFQHFGSLGMELGFGDFHVLLKEFGRHQSKVRALTKTGLVSRIDILYPEMVPGSWGHFFAMCFRSLLSKYSVMELSDHVFTVLSEISDAVNAFKSDHLLPLTFALDPDGPDASHQAADRFSG